MAGGSTLLRPKVVGVVGANDNPASFGGRFWRHLGNSRGVRREAVNLDPERSGIVGCAPSLADLSVVPDLVVLATPPRAVAGLLAEAAAVGSRAVIILTRVPTDQRPRVRQIAEDADLVVLGGSSLGLINANDGVVLSSSVSLELPLRTGPFALVSQSGAIMGILHARAMNDGLGLGLCISTGEQLQLRAERLLTDLAHEDDLAAVAGYLEDIEPESFAVAAATLRAAGRPLIVLKGGLSATGAAATAAHCDALASDGRAFAAFARELGVIVASDTEDLLACLHASAVGGRRYFIATFSGGLAAVAADVATRHGVGLPEPSERTMAGLACNGHRMVNPLDLDGLLASDDEVAKALAELARAPEADGAILVLSDKPGLDELVQQLPPASGGADSRLLVCSECSPQYEPALHSYVAQGGSIIRGVARLLSALSRTRQSDPVPAPHATVELEPVVESSARLAAANLPVLPLIPVCVEAELDAVIAQCGTPFVLKLATVEHRRADEVAVVADRDEAVHAWRRLAAKGAVAAQPLAPQGVEFFVGIRRDPTFGLIFLIGAGGPRLEALDDVAVHVGLPDRDQIQTCLKQTVVGRWLADSLGARAIDLAALVAAAARLADWASQESPALSSLDVNPIVVGAQGAWIVDAKIRYQTRALREVLR